MFKKMLKYTITEEKVSRTETEGHLSHRHRNSIYINIFREKEIKECEIVTELIILTDMVYK